jgi:hypothetical protein
MLHFCKWPDRVSLLVDAEGEGAARQIATDVAEGDAPSEVVALASGAFVAEVDYGDDNDGDDDDEGDSVLVVPVGWTADLLLTLEDGEAHGSVTPDVAACGESADAEGDEGPEVVFCDRGPGHDGDHDAATSSGRRVHWPR